jgi:hypothetical protein
MNIVYRNKNKKLVKFYIAGRIIPNFPREETPRAKSKPKETGTSSTASDSSLLRRIPLSIRRVAGEIAMSQGSASEIRHPEPPRSPSQSTEIDAAGAVRTVGEPPRKRRPTPAGMYTRLDRFLCFILAAIDGVASFSDGCQTPLSLVASSSKSWARHS